MAKFVPNYTQERKFIEDVVPRDFLAQAIEWAACSLNPEHVFSRHELEEWAEENGFVREE